MFPIHSTVSRRLAIAATLLAVPASARAQETQDTTSLPELVVTATRYPLAPDSLAATVTVLRGEDLRAQGIRFVSEALRQVPGAQVVQSGSYGGADLALPAWRRERLHEGAGGRDPGEPAGRHLRFRLAHDGQRRADRDPSRARQRALRLGCDRRCGADLHPRRPGRAGPGCRGQRGDATGPRSGSSADWEAPADLGWSASVSQRTTDGIYEFNNDYRNTAASGRVSVGAGSRTSAALTGRYTDGKFHFPTDFTGVPTDVNQYNAEETFTLGLDATHRFSDAIEGQLLVGRNSSNADFVNPAGSAGDGRQLEQPDRNRAAHRRGEGAAPSAEGRARSRGDRLRRPAPGEHFGVRRLRGHAVRGGSRELGVLPPGVRRWCFHGSS